MPFKKVHLLDGEANPQAEVSRYSTLLNEAPIDIVCLGIGENGHIAFNDPSVADFEDPQTVKEVVLETPCRQQQVNDGCFAKLSEVPETALSLTIPTLINADHLFCVVPGAAKKLLSIKLYLVKYLLNVLGLFLENLNSAAFIWIRILIHFQSNR